MRVRFKKSGSILIDDRDMMQRMCGAVFNFGIVSLILTACVVFFPLPLRFMGIYGLPDEISMHFYISASQTGACLAGLFCWRLDPRRVLGKSLLFAGLLGVSASYILVFIGEKWILIGLAFLVFSLILNAVCSIARTIGMIVLTGVILQSIVAFRFHPSAPSVHQALVIAPIACVVLWMWGSQHFKKRILSDTVH